MSKNKKGNNGPKDHTNKYASQSIARKNQTLIEARLGWQLSHAAQELNTPPQTEASKPAALSSSPARARHIPGSRLAEAKTQGAIYDFNATPDNVLASKAEWIQRLLPSLAQGTPYLIQNPGSRIEPRTYTPSEVRDQIEIAYALLTSERNGYRIKVPGHETAAILRKAIDEAQQASAEMVARKQREEIARDLRLRVRRLSGETNPDEAKRRIENDLSKLGVHAPMAYPDGVKTAYEMTLHIDARYKEAVTAQRQREELNLQRERVREAQNMFESFGSSELLRFLFRQPDNPDVALQKLRTAIADNLGGDVTKLDYSQRKNAKDLEAEIDQRHTQAVLSVAHYRLKNEHNVALNVNFFGDPLDNAKCAVEIGFSPDNWLYRAEQNNLFSGTSAKKERQTEIAAIKAEAALNDALHFAIVTYGYAEKGEPHAGMLTKTLKMMEAVGGADKLDGILGRMHITEKRWTVIKNFLASPSAEAVATPYNDPDYRKNSGDAGARPSAASPAQYDAR